MKTRVQVRLRLFDGDLCYREFVSSKRVQCRQQGQRLLESLANVTDIDPVHRAGGTNTSSNSLVCSTMVSV